MLAITSFIAASSIPETDEAHFLSSQLFLTSELEKFNSFSACRIQFKPSSYSGFGLFGKYESNPSWEAVSKLRQPDNVTLFKKRIDVLYDAVDKKIPEIWQDHKPSVSLRLHPAIVDDGRRSSLMIRRPLIDEP